MEIVTGYKGQPHVTAENWADLNRGIIGSDSYVLSVGRKFESELVSNNLLKIRDGAALIQGRQFVIPSGQSDEITIENGTQGEKRTDLIVARYTKNNDTKVEEVMPVYIKGTPSASDPVLPDYNTDGDIRAGDLTADMPLYALDLEGINVVAVRPLFNILESAAQLNSKIPDVYYEEVALHYYNGSYMTATVSIGKQFAGRLVQVTLIYRDGYPTAQTWNVSATPVDSSGNTTIWAYGSNYISSHVMNVLVRCETE